MRARSSMSVLRFGGVTLLALVVSAGLAVAQEKNEASSNQQATATAKTKTTQPAQKADQASGATDQTSEEAGAQTGRMMDQINQILEGEEEALAGGGYTYDPGDRRDPFESLLNARQPATEKGPRPEGVPGLLIDEVGVSGIFVTPDGAVAQVEAANKEKSYLVRVGDQLYDGEVVSISSDEVVFRQIVRDPTALKPFREVVKKLNP